MDCEKPNRIVDDLVLEILIRNTLKYDAHAEVQEKLIEPALRRLGFSCEQLPDLAFTAMADDFNKYFGLEMRSSGFGPKDGKVWEHRSLSTAQLSSGADRTLTAWARAKPEEFTLIAGPKQYNSIVGHVEPPPTRLRDGQMIHTGQSYFYCRYRSGNMLVSLHDIDVEKNGVPMWFWSTIVEWAEHPRDAVSFIETLNNRVDEHLVSERMGRVLGSTYQPISLQTYRLDELAYPSQIREDVEELVAAFDRWQSPACTVCHWGAALVGKPGTGKRRSLASWREENNRTAQRSTARRTTS